MEGLSPDAQSVDAHVLRARIFSFIRSSGFASRVISQESRTGKFQNQDPADPADPEFKQVRVFLLQGKWFRRELP
jgi:hypothetical protein